MARSTPRPPVFYSDDLADEICAAIENSHLGLRALCEKNKHWPHARTIRKWLADNEDFGHKYARAKAAQTENLIEEIIEISDNDSNDVLMDSQGGYVGNGVAISRARLKIDTRKWVASKLIPKKYGDKKEDENKSDDDFISKNRDKL